MTNKEKFLQTRIKSLERYLISRQKQGLGCWNEILEADNTVPCEYMLFRRFIGMEDHEENKKIMNYMFTKQNKDGGFPLFPKGESDLSCSVRTYLAFKVGGLKKDDEIMVHLREFILSKGGISKTNIFTKYNLAFFGQFPWDSVPLIPLEIIWGPFKKILFSQVSYWARCAVVPLMVIQHYRHVCKLSEEEDCKELWVEKDIKKLKLTHPFDTEKWISWSNFFCLADKVLHICDFDFYHNSRIKKTALDGCINWITEHVKYEGGNGAICLAMYYATMALWLYGKRKGDKDFDRSFQSCLDLVTPLKDPNMLLVQPCFSPVWDTCLTINSLFESYDCKIFGDLENKTKRKSVVNEKINENMIDLDSKVDTDEDEDEDEDEGDENEKENENDQKEVLESEEFEENEQEEKNNKIQIDVNNPLKAMRHGCNWLLTQQIEIEGDYKMKVKSEGRGWAFQYSNDFFPDVDDTAVVIMGLAKILNQKLQKRIKNGGKIKNILNMENKYVKSIKSAVDWILGMQSSNGGWGAFDKNNYGVYGILEDIPFATSIKGCLLDPPTADVSARQLHMFGVLGFDSSFEPAKKCIQFLKDCQEKDGSWYGRWGINYIYGTWCVIHGMHMIGEDLNQNYIQRAVTFLKSIQCENGGWSELPSSYNNPPKPVFKQNEHATPSQTAWAILSLIHAGEANSKEVKRGVQYLLNTQKKNGSFDVSSYTGNGFPRLFYLNYYGYHLYFPLWALSSYYKASKGELMNEEKVRKDNIKLSFWSKLF
ncbi:sporulenol synthase [Anaeramoeba flamelloides]|uniref:Sporulenol synthase n=1 Tax=Anaeramoeba flamelloides TaxID=1746091 RepID=A0ABQ8Y904_9EUKA|nr:sporulenol synthase [Anaeramoeba flamelloides]